MRLFTARLTASATTIVAALAATPVAAQTPRAEAVQSVRMFTAPTCPITPADALLTERTKTLESAGIVATLVGGVVGDLVGSGLNAIGEALEDASKEKGMVAEGVSHFMLGHIKPVGPTVTAPRFEPAESTCLILYRPGQGTLSELGTDVNVQALRKMIVSATGKDPIADGDNVVSSDLLKTLADLGMDEMPALYVEAQVWGLREGMVVRPVLVWYREKMKGAPDKPAASELHVSFATPAAPSASDIGTVFGGARMILPKVKPGTLLDWKALRASTSVVMPSRPTTGYVDAQVAAANTLYTTVGTRLQEERTAERSFKTAQRKEAANSTAETREALAAARIVYEDAQKDRIAAETARNGFSRAQRAGATNVKLRFVVIREPNQFGLALAKALKTRSAATGTAVGTALTEAMTAKPAWTPDDSAYVQALNAVDAKQREYDAAVASGDSAAIALKSDELRLAKAKLNEAAVKLKRPIPYPSLF